MSRLFSAAYSTGLTLWALSALLQKRARRSIRQRLILPEMPPVKAGGIWLHAVSLGETRAMVPLVQRLREIYPDQDWVISNTTEAGHEEAKRALPFAKWHLMLPLDYRRPMERLMAHAEPSLVLLAETDIWYHFLQAARRKGAKVVLVNGKISTTSYKRHRQFRSISRRLLGQVDHYCLQVPLYAERFQTLGIRPDQITVTGNVKWDGSYPVLSEPERLQYRQTLALQPGERLLIVGSTHAPEEELVLDAIASIPNLKTLIAPRHADRFEQVAQLIHSRGLKMGRWSQSIPSDAQVILLDTVGLLRTLFQLADLAIVAGSFTEKVGGHNILEPLGYGVPVLFGPHLWSQPGMAEAVLESKAGLQVTSAQLHDALVSLLNDPTRLSAMGQAGRDLIAQCRGSVDATVAKICMVRKETAV
jgi:3-deoxy-D-manno-octulosonic-acid transferase